MFAGIHDTSTPILTDTPLATPLTPASTTLSKTFDSSYGESTMTLDHSNLSLDPKRGQPRGDPKKPTFDDFPVNGTDSEKERRFKAKKSQECNFKKFTGPEAEAYRKSEN